MFGCGNEDKGRLEADGALRPGWISRHEDWATSTSIPGPGFPMAGEPV